MDLITFENIKAVFEIAKKLFPTVIIIIIIIVAYVQK